MTSPIPPDKVAELIAERAKLIDDVRHYSGNEAWGYTAIARINGQIADATADLLTHYQSLEEAARLVEHELRLSAGVFRDYGYQHQDKADATDNPREKAERQRKAKRNLDREAACLFALGRFAALTNRSN